jgi:hypothetical protein
MQKGLNCVRNHQGAAMGVLTYCLITVRGKNLIFQKLLNLPRTDPSPERYRWRIDKGLRKEADNGLLERIERIIFS